ncbi:MAG: Fis family transcriptional regulator [bacterium]|jgi:Fis family transcriptional regulator
MSTTYPRNKNNLSTSGANATQTSAKAMKDQSATASQRLTSRRNTGSSVSSKSGDYPDNLPARPSNTAIANCVQHELRRYFDLLDGEEPSNVYHLVMRQAEHALIESVMQECGGNQSKATKWLGISRGNLRNKLADMGYD